MVKVEVSVVINRPVGEIFDYIADPENSPKWQSGVLEAEQTSKGPGGVGTTDREVRKFLGRQIDQTFEVTEYEPNRMIKQRTTSGSMTLETRYAFESVEGGTRLTMWAPSCSSGSSASR
ncbi:MAG: SRPBCC family protein [Candidatus Promineifilaceae bacterium]